MQEELFGGVDVGAKQLHCIAINVYGEVRSAELIDPREKEALAAWGRRLKVVAVDSPDRGSKSLHADDETLAANSFRLARCCEIQLLPGRIRVQFATPPEEAMKEWMRVGKRVHEDLSQLGIRTVEMYPHGEFVHLLGGTPPSKMTPAGIRVRVAALQERGLAVTAMWSHDALDAAAAALVARDVESGKAVSYGCDHDGHDGSAIWLSPRAAV